MNNQHTIAKQLQRDLRSGDLLRCETVVCQHLLAFPDSPFKLAIGAHFTNTPQDVAAAFDAFFAREALKYEIGAAYTETNGFAINPDRWYFDLFAYEAYGGHRDYDWLSEWDSDPWEHVTLTGMEGLQALYAKEDLSHAAVGLASLLVVIRFQQLIAAAIPFMQQKDFPLLATAHDYEFIFEG